MFTLHHAHMAPRKGLEPLTFWLTARRSTIELPRNTIPLYMVGIEPTVSVRSGRCFTCKLIYSYCVVYTVRHPWNDKPLTTVYKCRMVTRGGIEPILYWLMRPVSLPLDYSAMWRKVWDLNPRSISARQFSRLLH